MKRAYLATVSALVLLFACSDNATTPNPQPRVTTPAGDDDDNFKLADAGSLFGTSSSSSSGSTPIDAATGGSAVTYRGTLDKTPTTPFGDGTHSCKYLVAMKNIVVEISITPEGQVIGGAATNDMVETLAETCVNKPLGTKPQKFSAGTLTADTLAWVGGPDNGPKMNLTTKLTKTGQSWQAVVTWVRTDWPTPDLAWTVTTTLTLGPE